MRRREKESTYLNITRERFKFLLKNGKRKLLKFQKDSTKRTLLD